MNGKIQQGPRRGSTVIKPLASQAPVLIVPPSSVRPVAYVRFNRPVDVPGFGLQRELTSGGETRAHGNPIGVPLTVPAMFRDGDTQELVIGRRRYPLAGGLIESYELARMAVGPSGDS